jgi:hypothetical protein
MFSISGTCDHTQERSLGGALRRFNFGTEKRVRPQTSPGKPRSTEVAAAGRNWDGDI